MDVLDTKLNEVFSGKVVRKDLLHRIKKGTNVPTFVLEFLLARYCASDDPAEIDAGMEAVLSTLQDNYVRPDESNKAQSYVQQHGKHRFIDKVHVTYKERERRHWAEMENFNSQRIAIPEKFYRGIDRILEGGIWAEVLVAHNEVEEDDYAFYIEELRPIQLSRFDFDVYMAGRAEFTRDEWLDVVVRTIGLEPSEFTFRQKLHLLTRMVPFVEKNYNFIELGPRGTGKSYVFSEFSPYSTLLSGGQASTPTLFYNNTRRTVGMVGFWDTIAFDEVGGVKIKDPTTITIMKDFMANGRFSRGADVIADASFAFIGNIDHSIEQLVRSEKHDLFIALPASFDLAIMDRFHTYLPGWEMPKNSSAYLTQGYGLITDYLAEAFHHVAKKTNRYDYVTGHCRFGRSIEGRDETGVKKTICGLLKILHPDGDPSSDELDEYVAYAVEGRRRIKEQMNKRKTDDEFALIQLTFVNSKGQEVEVTCPESKGVPATQQPARGRLNTDGPPPRILPDLPPAPPPRPPAAVERLAPSPMPAAADRLTPSLSPEKTVVAVEPAEPPEAVLPSAQEDPHVSEAVTCGVASAAGNGTPASAAEVTLAESPARSAGPALADPGAINAGLPAVEPTPKPATLTEKHFRISYGETGYSYASIFGDYLVGAKQVVVEDPYIRVTHQLANFLRFCELLVKVGGVERLELVTTAESPDQKEDTWKKFSSMEDSLLEHGINFFYKLNPQLHDREVRLSNGWTIKIGRGFDIYQKPEDWFHIGASDLDLRPCLETQVDIFRRQAD